MKELRRVEKAIINRDVDEIIIIANGQENGKVLRKYLKNKFKEYDLTYRIITKQKTSDGINHFKAMTILWSNWFRNREMLDYVDRNLINVPRVIALSEIDEVREDAKVM